MYSFVAFLDEVLMQIEEQVARYEPERGGALLGPLGQPLVTEFIHDEGARTSGVTFTPSRWLERQVQSREQADSQVEFKGMLHSHPGNMAWPSDGDHLAYQDSLLGAPWLGRLITPIVTARSRPPGDHEIALPSGVMSVFVAERRHASQQRAEVHPASAHVLPLGRDLAAAAAGLDGTPIGRPAPIDVDGQSYVCGVVGFPGIDLQVIAGPGYPFTAPVVIAAARPQEREAPGRPGTGGQLLAALMPGKDGADIPGVRALPLTWDLEVPDEHRLLSALTQLTGSADGPAGSTGNGSPQAVPGHAEPVHPDDSASARGEGSSRALAEEAVPVPSEPDAPAAGEPGGRPFRSLLALPGRILQSVAALFRGPRVPQPGDARRQPPEKSDDHDET